MNRHEGVSCDACLKSNFRGRRFKCLICYDYDLCANCHEESASSSSHQPDHPMQCILTRNDFELYYGGEVFSAEQPQSFTCPYCNKMGLTDVALAEHVSAEHTDTSTEVVCPVCAAMQGGEPNFVTDDFAGHLSLEHRTGQRDLISFLDEPSAIRHGGVRRIPHSGRALGGQRSRRSNMHFSSSGALSTLSPSGRESVDPITELLSHLTSVRRGPQSSQLMQLQQQIQMERQQISAARQQLERLPRRQPHPIASLSGSASGAAGSSSTPVNVAGGGGSGGSSNGATGFSGALSGNTFLQALTQQQAVNGNGLAGNGITISNFSQIPIASSSGSVVGGVSATSIGGGAGGVSGSAGGLGGVGAGAVGGAGSAANGAGAAGGQQGSNQSQFLLARHLTTPLDEKAQSELEVERADRAQFVQALVLSTIANLDAFRLEDDRETSDTTTTTTMVAKQAGGEVEVEEDVTAAVESDRRSDPSNNNSNNNNNNLSSNRHCTNNAVNNRKDEELEGEVVVVVSQNNNNVTCSDSRQQTAPVAAPPPVKPKPPTATKPMPHSLPNYERGAGRGGPSAGAGGGGGGGGPGGMHKGRAQRAGGGGGVEQQSQSNSGGGGASGGNSSSGTGGAGARDCAGSDGR